MDEAGRATVDAEARQVADAADDGDVPWQRGTARAALRHRNFTIFWSGMFASNIGTWMQTIVLSAWALREFDSKSYVGILNFAILGPLVLLAPVSGVIADLVDRRRYLVTMQSAQMLGAFVLAAYAATDTPNRWVVFAIVFATGTANALAGPGMSAISPSLVPRADLPGAVSLFSFQMNMSRVVGPIIGVPIYVRFGPAAVFAVNGVSYLCAVAGLVVAQYPRRSGASIDGNGFQRIASGFKIAWADPLVRRVLFILWTLSLLSLNFISFMAAHADRDIGIRAKSTAYGWLYASFGLGAAIGAFGVGSFFAKLDKARLIRPALAAFSVLLFAFGVLTRPAPAYPIAFALGFAYFAMITSLSTVLQSNISDEIRGRIMALWIMGFGGAVGLAALVWAPVADLSLRGLIVFGAVWGVVLAVMADPRRLTRESANA